MSNDPTRIALAEKAVEQGNGILRLEPAYVARMFIPPAFRLGLSEDEATVGEREVLSYTLASAATGPKLHVDSRRPTLALMEKLPGAAASAAVPTVATRNEFRPALDPVLAEPTTEPTE